MKRCHNWLYILLLLFLFSCTKEEHEDSCDAHVYGHVVETFYSDEIIFSTKPVADASVIYDNVVEAVTNYKGEYDFCLGFYGYFTFISEKMGYLPKSATKYINNKISHIDFYLEKPNENHHGWGPFPATSNGPDIEITPDGLSLYSRGDTHIYATKTVTLENNKRYKFKTDVRKDPIAREIYFGIIPQIEGGVEKKMTITINGWQMCLIDEYIYDTTSLDSVDVVLKIGVEGIDHPIGYFNNIKIIKE